ncbi:hypothetical protein [Arthrobacter psychrolactophilus]
MSVSERFHEAATKVLAGDDSIVAAQALEGVLLDEYFDDARTDELLYTLSLYSPGTGTPYSDAEELRKVIIVTLEQLGDLPR